MLYSCSLSDKVVTKDGEQRRVLLRIYGKIIQENPETVVTDSVIFALLAEKCMGPKLYGVFTGGRVEEYVKVVLQLVSIVTKLNFIISVSVLCQIITFIINIYYLTKICTFTGTVLS